MVRRHGSGGRVGFAHPHAGWNGDPVDGGREVLGGGHLAEIFATRIVPGRWWLLVVNGGGWSVVNVGWLVVKIMMMVGCCSNCC